MIKIIENQDKNHPDIECSVGDTFSLTVYQEKDGDFEAGMQLRFVIARTEHSENLIDKRIDINEDLTFTVTLTELEKAKLNIDNYLYKCIVYKNNKMVTRTSGHFDVKWGA